MPPKAKPKAKPKKQAKLKVKKAFVSKPAAKKPVAKKPAAKKPAAKIGKVSQKVVINVGGQQPDRSATYEDFTSRMHRPQETAQSIMTIRNLNQERSPRPVPAQRLGGSLITPAEVAQRRVQPVVAPDIPFRQMGPPVVPHIRPPVVPVERPVPVVPVRAVPIGASLPVVPDDIPRREPAPARAVPVGVSHPTVPGDIPERQRSARLKVTDKVPTPKQTVDMFRQMQAAEDAGVHVHVPSEARGSRKKTVMKPAWEFDPPFNYNIVPPKARLEHALVIRGDRRITQDLTDNVASKGWTVQPGQRPTTYNAIRRHYGVTNDADLARAFGVPDITNISTRALYSDINRTMHETGAGRQSLFAAERIRERMNPSSRLSDS